MFLLNPWTSTLLYRLSTSSISECSTLQKMFSQKKRLIYMYVYHDFFGSFIWVIRAEFFISQNNLSIKLQFQKYIFENCPKKLIYYRHVKMIKTENKFIGTLQLHIHCNLLLLLNWKLDMHYWYICNLVC